MAEKYTVLGAGHGGKAMAAHLASLGAEVALWNRTFDHIAVIQKRGGIDLEIPETSTHTFGSLKLVTSDLAEAIGFAQVIMVVLPSSAHAEVAKTAAPYLKHGQIVILHPGRTLGAVEFVKVMRDNGCTADVTVAEAGCEVREENGTLSVEVTAGAAGATVPSGAVPRLAPAPVALPHPERSVRVRPVRLLPRPVPLRVLALVPDGPPTWLALAGREYVVAHAEGPERIETAWWRGPDVRRDYFRVTTTDGRRLWVFRARTDGRWYLHGVFA